MIAKRCFFILSILYIYRSISFFVTVLPISSPTYYCSPKSNSTTTAEIIKRALSIYTGMGLSLRVNQTFCGDSIFSGHATMLVFSYLVIKECKKISGLKISKNALSTKFSRCRYSKQAESFTSFSDAECNRWDLFPSCFSLSLYN